MTRVEQLAKKIQEEWCHNRSTETLEGIFMSASICKFCAFKVKHGEETYVDKYNGELKSTQCLAVKMIHEENKNVFCSDGIKAYLNEEVEDVTQ